MERVMLHAAISDIANLHLAAADAKGLNLKISAQDIELMVDLGKLRQIVANLVGNAVKYTTEGEVNIRAEVRASPRNCASS